MSVATKWPHLRRAPFWPQSADPRKWDGARDWSGRQGRNLTQEPVMPSPWLAPRKPD